MEYVLVLNVESRAVLSFLDELQRKLKQQVSASTPFCLSSAVSSSGDVAHVLNFVLIGDVDIVGSDWICKARQPHSVMARSPARNAGSLAMHAFARSNYFLIWLARVACLQSLSC